MAEHVVRPFWSGVRKLTDEERALVTEHFGAMQEFKEFCDLQHQGTAFNDSDFTDLSLGFFIAKGITEDLMNDDVDAPAFALARLARYVFQYWCD